MSKEELIENGFDFDKVEKILRNKPTIRFSKQKISKQEIIKDYERIDSFIEFIIVKSLNSYYDKTGKLQCYGNSRRSLGDLYRLRIYYFPETNLKDFAFALWNLNYFTTDYCYDIKKRVYYFRDYIKFFTFVPKDIGKTNDEFFPGIIRNNKLLLNKDFI